jgi:hypothetical protein
VLPEFARFDPGSGGILGEQLKLVSSTFFPGGGSLIGSNRDQENQKAGVTFLDSSLRELHLVVATWVEARGT